MDSYQESFVSVLIVGLVVGLLIGAPTGILLFEPLVVEHTIVERVPVFVNETIYVYENTSVPIRIYTMTQPLNSSFYEYYWNATFDNASNSFDDRNYFVHTITVSLDNVNRSNYNLTATLDLPSKDWFTWHGIEVEVDGVYFQNVFMGNQKVDHFLFPDPDDELTFSSDYGALTCAIFGYGTSSPWEFAGFWSGRLTITVQEVA